MELRNEITQDLRISQRKGHYFTWNSIQEFCDDFEREYVTYNEEDIEKRNFMRFISPYWPDSFPENKEIYPFFLEHKDTETMVQFSCLVKAGKIVQITLERIISNSQRVLV